MAAPSSVDEYIAALPEERRVAMNELRRTINAAAPGTIETIAYQMPAVRGDGGQFVVSYAAYKRHYGLYPASGAVRAALGAELTPYLSGKGTIRFRADEALPAALVTRIVRVRLAEIAQRPPR